jgi:MFS family permease
MREVFGNPTIRRFAVTQFLLEVQFWFPVYLIYLLDLGFSLATAVVVDGVFRLVSVACELPMGVLADRLGRRRTYLCLAGASVVTFAVIAQVETTPGVFAAWVLWGCLWALTSGAAGPYLYDLAVHATPAVDPARALGAVRAVGHAAVLASLLAAGYLYQAGPTVPFVVTAVLAAVALVVAWSLPEVPDDRRRTTIASLAREAGRAVASPPVRLVVAVGALLLLLGWTPRILFQPLARDLGYSPAATGWMYAAFAAAAVAAGLVAAHVPAAARSRALTWTLVLIPAVLVAAGCFPRLAPFLFLPVLGFVYALGTILVEVLTNEVTSRQVRATVFSVAAAVGGIGIAFARPAAGIAADEVSVGAAFTLWAGGGALIAGIAVVLVRRLGALTRSGGADLDPVP